MKKDPVSMRCLIVDDEAKAHRVLEKLIRSVSWLEIAGACYSVPQALDMIAQQAPDIVFLDVQMPGMTGLDLLKSLPQPRPYIILTTAHREYALEAYQNEVPDFLLKPIVPSEFLRAVLKVRRQGHGPERPAGRFFQRETGRNNPNPHPDGNIWVRVDGKMFRVAFREIYAVIALKDYVKVLFAEGMLITYSNLTAIHGQLPEETFVRIHRSHIVNREAIRSIEGNVVKLVNGTELGISGRGFSRDAIIRKLTR